MEIITSFISDFAGQIQSWPNEAVILFALVALGYMIKLVEFVPNRIIPLITFVVAVSAEIATGTQGELAWFSDRNAVFRLGCVGMALWLIAWLTHATVLKRIEEKLGLFQSNTEPKTEPKGP